MDLTPAVTAAPPSTTLARAFLLRFGFAYSVLFMIRVVPGAVQAFDWLDKLIDSVVHLIVSWVAHGVFGISRELEWGGGSGDKTLDWIWLVCCLVLALIASLVWLAVDRRRAHDAKIRAALRVFLRYSVAYTLLFYGIGKLFTLQFSTPSGGRLLQPYGESSPMGLLWTFMGASPAYEFFSGAAETVGGLLLLSRRTATLGALVLGVVLVNVVMMNFCYDVPVKINSVHYLVMCVYLMSPDVAALLRFFVLRRPAQPHLEEPLVTGRRSRVVRLVLKYGMNIVVLISCVYVCVYVFRPDVPDAWYDGVWQVTAFQRNGQIVPPALTETTRWNTLLFQVFGNTPRVRWRYMDGVRADRYTVTVDDKAQTMTFQHERSDGDRKAAEPAQPPTLHYVRGDATHLTLDGKFGDDAIVVEMVHFDPDKTLLMSRGFHWINETSFNR
jgi:uncharacterized membrane protein YphA (DoxX/SURF4 family)